MIRCQWRWIFVFLWIQAAYGSDEESAQDIAAGATPTLVTATAQARMISPNGASHWADVRSMAFHPDGSLLATGGVDQCVRVWDANTLRPVDVIDFLPGIASHIDFASDGRLFVVLRETTDEDVWRFSHSSVLVLNREGDHWVEQSRLTGFTRHIQSIVISSDAKWLFFDDAVHAVHCYDITGEHPIWKHVILFPSKIASDVPGPPRPSMGRFVPGPHVSRMQTPPLTPGGVSHRSAERPMAIALSQDDSLLAITTDKKTRTYNLADGYRMISEVEAGGTAIAITPDKNFLIVGQTQGPLRVWSLEKGGMSPSPRSFELNIKNLTSLDLSNDGKHLAIGQSQQNPALVATVDGGSIGPDVASIMAPMAKPPLGTANQDLHWNTSRANPPQNRAPVAIHPDSNCIATTRSGRTIQLSELNGTAKVPDADLETKGSSVSLWTSSNRRVQWLPDRQSLFVTTPKGGAVVDAQTGIARTESPSMGFPTTSRNGEWVLYHPSTNYTGHSVVIRNTSSGETAKETLGEITETRDFSALESQPAKVCISPDGDTLASISRFDGTLTIVNRSSKSRRSISLKNFTSQLVGFDLANRLWVTSQTESDIGGRLHQLDSYKVRGDKVTEAETTIKVLAESPHGNRFVGSPDFRAVVFQDETGRFRIVSDPKSKRSAKPINEIQCVSSDGEFLVTLRSAGLAHSIVSTVHAKTGHSIERWHFTGLITDLDLSSDDRSIATANADGSIGILTLMNPADWPTDVTNPRSSGGNPQSAPVELQNEFDLILKQAAVEIAAYKKRIAAASTGHEIIETQCSEPYSAICLRLDNLAQLCRGTDLEFKALHVAIGYPSIRPKWVPAAAWVDKHRQWSKLRRELEKRLNKIARLDFADRFYDDPRTASVLKQVIHYWRSTQNDEVIEAADEFYLRTSDPSVKAAALLWSAEANMTEQVEFLMSGQLKTPPTALQLRKAGMLLDKVIQNHADVQIDGIGSVAEKAAELKDQLKDTITETEKDSGTEKAVQK